MRGERRGRASEGRRDRRAISDVLGFILVFSLVITTVGIVYAGGFTELQGVRDQERVTNAERAFEVLADNVEDLVDRGAPSRATEMKLADAQLRLGEPVLLNVTGKYVTGANSSEDFTTGNLSLTPVVFTGGDGATVRYAAGAVVRTDTGGGAVMMHEPGHVIEDDTVVLSVVQTNGDTGAAIGGSRTALVRMDRTLTDVIVSESDGTYDRVSVEMTTPAPDPWVDYLESEGLSCSTPAPDRLSCSTTDVDRLYVVIVKIDVSLI